MATIQKMTGAVGISTGGTSWGNISGDINNQSDLVSSLNSNLATSKKLIEEEANSRAYNDAIIKQDLTDEINERKQQDEFILSQITWSKIKEPFYKDEANDSLQNVSLEHHFNKYNKDIDLVIGTFPTSGVPMHWYHTWNSEGQKWEWSYNRQNDEGVTSTGQVLCAQYWKVVEE